jgi:Subtilase family
VSAIRQDGSVPAYSNRDAIFVDMAAPGDNIFSTIPLSLTTAGCADGPYSDCGPPEFRDAIGTSFAAPQVSAAAALILGQDPALKPDQVSWLLERSAADESAANGCPQCPPGRDAYTGWGRLDIQAALTDLTTGTPLPPPDLYEPNDDAGALAHALPPLPRTISATLDYWDDQIDVYRVVLKKGQRLFARLTPQEVAATRLALWRPGTQRVEGLDVDLTTRLVQSTRAGVQERLAYTARVSGTYYLEAKLIAPARDSVVYRLSLVKKGA